jgi:hypothetical protein
MRLTIPEEVLSRELDGEMVLLDLRSGRYFGLNATAARVWEMLKAQMPEDTMVQALVDEFDVTDDRARADIEAFVTVLVDRGLAFPVRAAV